MLLSEKIAILENALPNERKRLVRLCARLTGDVDAAEDLAQETLLEAWRHAHKLHDPNGFAPWLSAIARNVCLRWGQRCGRELPHLAHTSAHGDEDAPALVDGQADAFDVEVELERHELATLLDRALALLPPATRTALIAHYIEETPLAEIAARLRMTDSAIKARVHRGKLTLRRVLISNFPAEAAAYGLLENDPATAQETRIWCSECGQAKLRGIFDREKGELSLGCPNCSPGHVNGYLWSCVPGIFQGVKGYRAALSRQVAWVHGYAWQALKGQAVTCVYCGGPTAMQYGPPIEGPPTIQGRKGVHMRCMTCHTPTWIAIGSLALSLPEGRQFWQRHPRIHALPERCVEAEGVAAIVRSYGERAGSARFDVVFASDTLEVIGTHSAAVQEEA